MSDIEVTVERPADIVIEVGQTAAAPSATVAVDDDTIDRDAQGRLRVKPEGIDTPELSDAVNQALTATGAANNAKLDKQPNVDFSRTPQPPYPVTLRIGERLKWTNDNWYWNLEAIDQSFSNQAEVVAAIGNNSLKRVDNVAQSPGGGGLTQDQVDARVAVGVEDWAESGNTDVIPDAKLPAGGTVNETSFKAVFTTIADVAANTGLANIFDIAATDIEFDHGGFTVEDSADGFAEIAVPVAGRYQVDADASFTNDATTNNQRTAIEMDVAKISGGVTTAGDRDSAYIRGDYASTTGTLFGRGDVNVATVMDLAAGDKIAVRIWLQKQGTPTVELTYGGVEIFLVTGQAAGGGGGTAYVLPEATETALGGVRAATTAIAQALAGTVLRGWSLDHIAAVIVSKLPTFTTGEMESSTSSKRGIPTPARLHHWLNHFLPVASLAQAQDRTSNQTHRFSSLRIFNAIRGVFTAAMETKLGGLFITRQLPDPTSLADDRYVKTEGGAWVDTPLPQGPGGVDGVVDSVDTELNGTSLDTTLGRTLGADLADSVDLSPLVAGGTTPHPDDSLVAGSHHRLRYNTPALSYFGGQLHGIRLATSSNSIYIDDEHGTETKVVDGVYLGDSAGDFGGAQVTTEFTAFVDTDRLKIVSRDAIGTVVTDIDVLDGLDAVDDWHTIDIAVNSAIVDPAPSTRTITVMIGSETAGLMFRYYEINATTLAGSHVGTADATRSLSDIDGNLNDMPSMN